MDIGVDAAYLLVPQVLQERSDAASSIPAACILAVANRSIARESRPRIFDLLNLDLGQSNLSQLREDESSDA